MTTTSLLAFHLSSSLSGEDEKQERKHKKQAKHGCLRYLVLEWKLVEMLQVKQKVRHGTYQHGDKHRLDKTAFQDDESPTQQDTEAEIEAADISHQMLIIGGKKGHPGVPSTWKAVIKTLRRKECPQANACHLQGEDKESDAQPLCVSIHTFLHRHE